ncbi:nitroreductase family deazaflavin-dependent oxidoreductase [Nocardia donostiensis]|uniref:Nitroreductase n=1 Tax=Nocardia donostiensis TaxID=1538463 RepID=A0A1V2TKD8_9NOCA|nr:nitroreductase family deazaflavin-dependent oxidoreductase [Nocardia donostiensis]ONM50000.1 nitroreductase [Nocardia donostiensis]OQS17953.1 nitroreductase [Nocardia donostiensis]
MTGSYTLPPAVADRLVRLATRALHNRHLMRAPIWLYRARLGFLLGSRLLMLEHRGRKTGLRRYVILEVIDHPEPDRYVVVSGFGTKAQWFRNIQADPRTHVWTGRRHRTPATARVLLQEQAAASLQRYTRQHPRAWETMKPAVENTLGAPIDERAPELPMVELHLTQP